MFGLGWSEILILFVLALVLAGPARLRRAGERIAEAFRMLSRSAERRRELPRGRSDRGL
jgi:Sec-independent protein translocase protein TatA